MKTISVAIQKGGTGKTTTALAIGTYFADKGKRILFVDMDSQHNLSSVFGIDTSRSVTVYDVIRGEADIYKSIFKTDAGDVIAGSEKLASKYLFEKTKAKVQSSALYLKKALEEVQDMYDYCIIDCPPSIGYLLVNALATSDGIVLPINAESFSQDGFDDFLASFKTIKDGINKNIELYGVLLTKYNNRTGLHRIIKSELEQTALDNGTRVFDTQIRSCIALAEAQRMQEPSIYKYAPKSNASIDYTAFCEELEKFL